MSNQAKDPSRPPSAGRGLIATGAVGAILAAICCATPLLAVMLGGIGLSAWLAGADYVLMPALLAGIVLIGLGLYRRSATAPSRNDRDSRPGPRGV
jgi:mercuric ion transport protein